METIKAKLTVCVRTILVNLKFQNEITELTDEYIQHHLTLLLDEDEQAIYIKDKLIVASIKEYLYHLLNEIGGVGDLKDYECIVFAGSACNHKPYPIVELVKPKPNEVNVLMGV